MLVTDTYSVAYPNLSANGVIPIKLKRKTHPCCGAEHLMETHRKRKVVSACQSYKLLKCKEKQKVDGKGWNARHRRKQE